MVSSKSSEGPSDLFALKASAIDGRLANLRVRHEALRALSHALVANRERLRAALDRTQQTQHYFDLALASTLRDIAIHAGALDQVKQVAREDAFVASRSCMTHDTAKPRGLVAVRLGQLSELAHPLDAVFGPIAAAVAAGNSIALIHSSSCDDWATAAGLVVSAALQRDTFQRIEEDSLATSDWSSFDQIVDWCATSFPGQATLKVSARPVNVVIVDHSVVDERLYRHPEKHSRVAQKAREHLANIAAAIEAFPGHIDAILVTETIVADFRQSQTSATLRKKIQAMRSVSHTVQKLEDMSGHSALHLFAFADSKTAAYYAAQAPVHVTVIDALPAQLGVGYAPTPSSVRLSVRSNPVQESDAFALEPLWSPRLFEHQGTIVRQTPATAAATAKLLKAQESALARHRAPIAPMQRSQPDHMEFFPTGFKITFFPLAFTLLGGVGFVGIKMSMLAYRTVKSHW